MSYKYTQPGKIKVSKETKADILDVLDEALYGIADRNYTEPKSFINSDHHEKVLDLNDLYREIQGADYLIELLQKIKAERTKDINKLLKQVNRK